MGDYEILDLSSSQKWNKYLRSLPIDQQDIYFTPEYYQLYEELGDGLARCFVYEDGEDIALYPFLLNSVNKLGYNLVNQYYDIQGAYGHNGIIATSKSIHFLSDLLSTFLKYCKDNCIVAEFIRFNPIIKNHIYSNYITPVDALNSVIINLEPSIDSIWNNSLEGRARTAINKANRLSLEFVVILGDDISVKDIAEFRTIYLSTMKRNDADDFYFFTEEYFVQLIRKISENLILCFAKKDGIAISTEIDLFKNENAYAFLGGTLLKYNEFNPNSFLRYELIKALKEYGVKKYSIGGGHTRNDSIYKYKKSFNKNSNYKFYIGKKIHNLSVYNNIVSQWEAKYPEKIEKYKNFLLKYRY